MATHSSILVWRIPGTEEPSGLPSMGSHRVCHDWSDLAAAAAWLINKWCHDSYRWTVKGLSHTYTCIHFPPNSPPIQVAISPWADHVLLVPLLSCYKRIFGTVSKSRGKRHESSNSGGPVHSGFSCVQLFLTLRTAACQASLSITNSQSLFKLMSMELVIPSNHLILCHLP